MLDVAIRRPDGSTAVDLGRRAAPPLPVAAALAPILPEGLRRGSTIAVTGSISVLLALLGAASAEGAWCALVGFPYISAEAAAEYGIALPRLAVVRPSARKAADWTTAVGALLDAVDIVAARPPPLAPGEVRRLAARARNRDAVLMPFLDQAAAGRGDGRGDGRGNGCGDGLAEGAGRDGLDWPGADVRLRARPEHWTGIGAGTGRLRARRIQLTVEGRGRAARPRSATLWLPAAGGGVAPVAAPESTRLGALGPQVGGQEGLGSGFESALSRAG